MTRAFKLLTFQASMLAAGALMMGVTADMARAAPPPAAAVQIGNFTFKVAGPDGEARDDRHLDQRRRYSRTRSSRRIGRSNRRCSTRATDFRSLSPSRTIRLFLLPAPAHDGHDRRQGVRLGTGRELVKTLPPPSSPNGERPATARRRDVPRPAPAKFMNSTRVILPHLDGAYNLGALPHPRSGARRRCGAGRDASRFSRLRPVSRRLARAWLFTIVRNCCRTAQAGAGGAMSLVIHESSLGEEAAAQMRKSPGRSPDSRRRSPAQGSMRSRSRGASRPFPEPFREAVVLRDLEESVLCRDRRSHRRADRHRDVAAGARTGDPRQGTAAAEQACRRAVKECEVMSACADQELLLGGLVDGELDAANVAMVEAHVARCEGCREELERLAGGAQPHERCDGVRHTAPEALAEPDRGLARAWQRLERPMTTGSCGWLAPWRSRSIGRLACDRHSDPARRALDRRSGNRVEPCPFAAARPPHRRADDQPAYRETLVQRQDRLFAAGARACRPRLSACRRAVGFDRWQDRCCDRLSPEAAHREPVRLAGQGRGRTVVRKGRLCGQGMEPQRPSLCGNLGHPRLPSCNSSSKLFEQRSSLVEFANCPVDVRERKPELACAIDMV